MTETVIVAVLSLIGTMAGAYFANKKSAALIAYRLEELRRKWQSTTGWWSAPTIWKRQRRSSTKS